MALRVLSIYTPQSSVYTYMSCAILDSCFLLQHQNRYSPNEQRCWNFSKLSWSRTLLRASPYTAQRSFRTSDLLLIWLLLNICWWIWTNWPVPYSGHRQYSTQITLTHHNDVSSRLNLSVDMDQMTRCGRSGSLHLNFINGTFDTYCFDSYIGTRIRKVINL